MNKVGYTDQNRLDPQWVPSDAEMIDWIEKGGHKVTPALSSEQRGQWHVFHSSLSVFCAFTTKPTWRAAVEDAMRREVSQ